MDRPLVIIVADSMQSLKQAGGRAVGADFVLVPTKIPKREERRHWGHALFFHGEAGANTLGGVDLAWAPGDSLASRVALCSAPQKLVISTSPVRPDQVKVMKGRAMHVPIGRGVYCIEIGRDASGERHERIRWKDEHAKPKAWRNPKPKAPKPAPVDPPLEA